MKRKRLIIAALLVIIMFQGLSSTAWAAVTVKGVAREFICNCGCNKGLANCDMKCGQELRGFIGEQIDDGQTKQDIVAFMKSTYGKEVLAAPEKSGFDLTAWITPFAVIFAGSVGVIKVMSGWVARRKNDDDEDDNNTPPPDHTYDDRINKELEDFGW